MIVIADTTPLNYLVLIGHVKILPELYGRVLIPRAVWEELQRSRTPEAVRTWIGRVPAWLEIRGVQGTREPELANLGAGEREAIILAEELHADLIILDEHAARRLATRRNLTVIGTLGVLAEAAERGLLDFSDAIDRLRQTSFYVSPEVLAPLLDRYGKKS
jgi:predicted nucleic acid-binding protein